MPTTRPRYQVTETPQVARALDRAAKRWPGEPRSKLLLRLVEVGAGTLEHDENAEDGATAPLCWQAVAATQMHSAPAIWLSCGRTGPRDRDGRERYDRAFEPRRSASSGGYRDLVGQRHAGQMLVHTITLAEVLVGGVRVGQGASMRDDLRAAGIATAPHDDGESLRLAELRASSGLKMPDCCVLDVAMQHQASLQPSTMPWPPRLESAACRSRHKAACNAERGPTDRQIFEPER